MSRRILKTDSWAQSQHPKNSIPKVRMSEEIAKNISNNLVNRRPKRSNLQDQLPANDHSNIKTSTSFLKKSREISFNNNITHQTIASDFLDSTGKYTSFGDSFSRSGINSLEQNPKFIGQLAESKYKNNVWGPHDRPSHARRPTRGTGTIRDSAQDYGKENMNFINSGIARSNFTLNPENEYNTRRAQPKLTCVSEEASDQSSTLTHERSLAGRGRGKGEGSTMSSTTHSKPDKAQENIFALSIRRFSNKLKNVESQDGIDVRIESTNATEPVESDNSYFTKSGHKNKLMENSLESRDRKTKSKLLNKSNTVKALILDSVPGSPQEPIQVFNLQVESRPDKTHKSGKQSRPRRSSKRKKKNRNRGEVSGTAVEALSSHRPDGRLKLGPPIRAQMAKFGLKTKSVGQTEHRRPESGEVSSRGARTENTGDDSNAFGFSKRNMGSMEGESYLQGNTEDHSISRHNKFLRTGRKQRSNIKIQFGQSLTPKNQVIRGQRGERVMRKSKSIGGKRLFEAMERHKIGEEVQKRMQAVRKRVPKVPLKIRSHDDVMKKSADFISGANVSKADGANASLAESILKKKEISQVSLDLSGT